MHSWELDRVEPREGRLTHVMWCRWCRRLEELQRRSEFALDDAVEELRLAFQSHCASAHGPNCPKVG